MLAVGSGPDEVQKYVETADDAVQIGCFNSPSSVTLAGTLCELEKVKARLDNDYHFSRLVYPAYHSRYVPEIGDRYQELLQRNCDWEVPVRERVQMFSTVTGPRREQKCDAEYWKKNIVSPVCFD